MNDLEIHFNAPEGATPAELAAYLDKACGGDAVLRARVEALFARDAVVDGSFMETVVARTPAQVEQPGEVIGNYKLLQKIGEGGFGVVYMADQLAPVRRRVALKIIKPGMDTRQVVARFEAERQVLAMMDHPNIARVFDAGVTASGRPYFVMELVRGIPVTRFCDERNLSTVERLRLFMDVCHAVQHAHQKGVIHRDLKPSNVMVSLHDEKPVPKVIDFGVAKATQHDLTDKTLFTQFEQIIGTPAYMSPEQAQMNGLDIDTRSDIYSLGVLLYELLTGRPPFDAGELARAGYEEMRRVIREVDPPRPSTRLSTAADAELTELARHRNLPPGKLRGLLRGDLDWIIMRAMEKDRARRYDTANSLAMDIARHLADEPVLAGPPGAAYLMQKFARRHKAALRVAALITTLLVAATVVSTMLAFRASRAEQEVTRQLELVRKERDATALARGDLGEVLHVLIGMSGSPDTGQKDNAVAMALLRERVALMDGIFARMEKRNTLRDPDTLWVLGHLASLLEAAGEVNRAVKLREDGARVSSDLFGAESPDALGAKARVAAAYEKAARFDEAAKLREELLPVLERVRGKAHPDTSWVRFALLTQYEVADAKAVAAGEKPAHHDDIVRLRGAMLAASTEKHGIDSIPTLHLRHNLAYEMSVSGRKEDALRLSRETLAIARSLPPSPDSALFLRYSVWCLAWHCGENQLASEAGSLKAELLALHPKLRPIQSAVVGDGASWRWLHPVDGEDPGKTAPGFHEAFQRRDFDDGQWNQAAMQAGGFGYGTGFTGTDIGTPPAEKRHNAYFRCHFTTTAPLSRLELRARRDDGLIACLDGKEIARDNVPAGPDAWKLDALQGVNEDEMEVTMAWPIPGELPAGEHVLAISVHNFANNSDLRLSGVTLVELAPGQ